MLSYSQYVANISKHNNICMSNFHRPSNNNMTLYSQYVANISKYNSICSSNLYYTSYKMISYSQYVAGMVN